MENAEYKFGKYEKLEEGSIKIRTGSNVAKLILFDALEKFGKDYPNIKIEISTGAPKESEKMIYSGEIDMLMTYLPYKLEYNNLQTIECARKEYIFAMSKRYFEKNKVHIEKIEDLNKYSLIVPKKKSSVRYIFDNNFKEKITQFHYEIAQEQMKKEFIMRDMGIGFLIEDEVKEELKTGEIVKVDLKKVNCQGSIGIVTLEDKLITSATKKLIEYIKISQLKY